MKAGPSLVLQKFKYIDDLAVLDAVETNNKLVNYDVWKQVCSDVTTKEKVMSCKML